MCIELCAFILTRLGYGLADTTDSALDGTGVREHGLYMIKMTPNSLP